uniref:Uncharacterized protein n=1 Tax=Proboscia inermis TaxID=420281 RepID=A0A7S0CDY7_9STRA
MGETGFFSLWIIPVYFLGGPANGNLARGIWNGLDTLLSPTTIRSESSVTPPEPCPYCRDTRCVPCPNCDDASGYYVTYNREVQCNCCKGRGLVICRSCFGRYDQDPNDLEGIREFMSRMPD